MKKNLILLAVAIATMASCSKNEGADPTSNKEAINFKTFIGNQTTKANEVEVAAFANFFIDACYTGQSDFETTDGTRTTFMNGQVVKKNADAWTYSPTKYWSNTVGDKISFFGYSTNEDTKHESIVMSDLTVANSEATLTFTCPETAATQVDLMAAKVVNQAKQDNAIQFDFSHILSQIKFNVKTASAYEATAVTIKSVKIDYSDTFAGKGVYDFTTNAWTKLDTPMADDVIAADQIVGTEMSPLATPLMLIPQILVSNDIQCVIVYDVVTTDENNSANSSTITNTSVFEINPTENKIEMGKKYIYNITINLVGVKVSGTTTPWDADGEASNFDVIVSKPL